MNGISSISELEQEELLLKLEVFKIKGKDKHDRKILRIIGKFFPGNIFLCDLNILSCIQIISVSIIYLVRVMIYLYLFGRNSTIRERRCCEKVSGGEDFPQVGEEKVLGAVRAQRG